MPAKRFFDKFTAENMRLIKVLAKIAYATLMIFEAVLGLRFILKLISASGESSFPKFIYLISDFILRPFSGLAVNPVSLGNLYIDTLAILAIFLYLVLAFILVELIKALSL
ncbi:hypothetical protein GF357_01660 [Candidatus Dojkabacteria bacterium]|nr:hypothetical protein [Candidatus Dojkabacteria bacterium]